MKKSELKEKLRSLVKELLMEMLLEDKMMSSLISECLSGIAKSNILESMAPKINAPIHTIAPTHATANDQKSAMRSRYQRLMEANNKIEAGKERLKDVSTIGGINVFEGITPEPDRQKGGQFGALKDRDPNDAGVSLANIPGLSGLLKG